MDKKELVKAGRGPRGSRRGHKERGNADFIIKEKYPRMGVEVIFATKREQPARTTQSQKKCWSLKLVVVKFGPKG